MLKFKLKIELPEKKSDNFINATLKGGGNTYVRMKAYENIVEKLTDILNDSLKEVENKNFEENEILLLKEIIRTIDLLKDFYLPKMIQGTIMEKLDEEN